MRISMEATDLRIPFMKTTHRIFFSDSANMGQIANNSIALVVTSPPYPMIEMWDNTFIQADPRISYAIDREEGYEAWEHMHAVLNNTWSEAIRVLQPGGIICINIGDATRKIGQNFSLYPNHSSIIRFFISHGLSMLPAIIWRKQSNKPNKFMGSGMLPTNAYVTLEHEYILIFRKGTPRVFSASEKENRSKSALFWEERNSWFSDIWSEIKGTPQLIMDDFQGKEIRSRSAAFPDAIPSRLINMYSIMGDTVLDPFLGTGTTTLAALASGRNSVGFEKDAAFYQVVRKKVMNCKDFCKSFRERRIAIHTGFMDERRKEGRKENYISEHYPFETVTRQEIHILLPELISINEIRTGIFEGEYSGLSSVS